MTSSFLQKNDIATKPIKSISNKSGISLPAVPAFTSQPVQKKGNNTGLPNNLKTGVENLSGFSMDDVKVHYNSDKPSQLQALAYAQGTDIHVAPGQEKHLPHEAWHVVQQKQGRVQPTLQMKQGIAVNDDEGLENEATTMGEKALAALPQYQTIPATKATGSFVIQQKGRIDTSKITAGTGENAEAEAEKKKKDIEAKIQALKEEKRNRKTLLTANWVKNADGSGDVSYNTTVAGIREQYEKDVAKLAEETLGKDHPAFVQGDAYYGKQEGDKNVFKRPDNKKEYVKDMRGTFVPRYARRELNKNDVPRLNEPTGLQTTGISTYNGLLDKGKVHNLDGMGEDDKKKPISWPHREFMQQSRGGGGNQFAFSHTSTKRPILSNAHSSFGVYDNGAILTDLSKINKEKIAAQWTLHPTTGHKVMLGEGVHTKLGDATGFKNRDETVRMSGYRNMEVLTEEVPQNAIAKKPGDAGWGGADVGTAQATAYNVDLARLKLLNTQKDAIKQKKLTGRQKSLPDARKQILMAANKKEADDKKEAKEAEIDALETQLKNSTYGAGTSPRGALMTAARRELEK